MIVSLAQKMSSSFIAMNVIKEEERQIYDYSFQLLLSTILNSSVLIILSVIAGRIFETALFMITFITLRQLAGGYHARTHFRCFLIMLLVYSIFLIILFSLPAHYYTYVVVASVVISMFTVFLIAPVADANKPLTSKERNKLSQKSRLILSMYILAGVIYTFFSSELWPVLSVYLGMLAISVSMSVAYAKNIITNKRI